MTCSVIVCSTWIRGLHSMKKCSPRLGIDQELDGAGVLVPRRRARASRHRRGCAGAARRRDRAPARPRRPSGGAAGPSSRARRDARRCRWPSPRTCTSMWRGRGTIFSRNTAPSPKAACASPWQRANASSISSGPSRRACRARRRRPTPSASPDSRSIAPSPWPPRLTRAPRRAGDDGNACFSAKARAATLSPNSARAAGEGPMKRRPSARQRSANLAFSDRKP